MLDTILKVAGILTVIGTFIGAIYGARKYYYEKNRLMYEKRLNEVYAPLYGLIVKQEILRELFFPHVSVETAPILSSSSGFWDRHQFIKVLNETRLGLARPKLLRLIHEYQALVYIEDNFKSEKEKWEKASKKKVEVEADLIEEIQNGYTDTMILLDIDSKNTISDIERYKK